MDVSASAPVSVVTSSLDSPQSAIVQELKGRLFAREKCNVIELGIVPPRLLKALPEGPTSSDCL